MADILLFHSALGQTPGFLEFAEALREAGHTVHAPDLYDEATFDSIDAGVEHAKSIGFGKLVERGEASAHELPAELVYAGFSLGVMPAQKLAQTRPGAKGAILISAALPPAEFGEWPGGVPVQIHLMEGDPWSEEDLPEARVIEATVEGAELFLYDGDAHLFADSSIADYNAAAAELLMGRMLEFLGGV